MGSFRANRTGLAPTESSEMVRKKLALGCALFRLAGSMDDSDVEGLEKRADTSRLAADVFLGTLANF